jgi:putative ABC transport system permease protein
MSTATPAISIPASAPVKAPSISSFRLALNHLRRDLSAGELRLLLVAVMLAVAALSAVGFFADRLQSSLARDARQLLGGDAIVASDKPPPQAVVDKARSLGLQVATSTAFPSMGRAPEEKGGAARLVSVKAVSDGYPLRGQLQLKRQTDGDIELRKSGPSRGTVWVDQPVLDALNLAVGDRLLLGDAALTIDRIIVIEPDRGAGFLGFAPRVMLHADDLPATALVQPASRVNWRLAVAAPEGRDSAVALFVKQTEADIQREAWRGVRVESMDSGRPEMGQTLARAEMFLNLVALLAALLAAVAVAIAARDFAQRHLDDCAMLRVLGLPQRRIAQAYALEFALVGLVGSAAGLLLGWLVHHVFVWLLSQLFNAELPAAGLRPALFGLGVGMTLLIGFGLPPVLQLAQVPPLRVLRRDVGQLKAASLLVMGAGALGFAALLLAVASDLKLGGIAVGGFALAVAVFALLAWLAVLGLRRAVPEARAPRWLLLATRQVAARPAFAVLQVSSLAVGLLALVLLVLLRTDLIASWRQATPPDAPDRFVINIQPDQTQAFRERLDGAGVLRYDWFAMIRGRLVTINGQPVQAEGRGDRAQRLIEREFNLSHGAELPKHNEVVAGRWTPDEADALSVEEGLAQTLGLKLGDRLGFDIAGQVSEGRITSLRKVDWASMRVNFFVMFPTAKMPAEVPVTFISAFKAPAVKGFDNAMSREFPNITSVDVSASVQQVQQVLDKVIRAVEFLFGFTLAAGLVVLFAAVTATRESRAREYALMRAMGASSGLLAQVQRAELLGVGALAGFLASVAAAAVGWALARFAFEFAWNPSPWVLLQGTLAGALLAWAAGWWGLRGVLTRPVVQTLRQAVD